MIPAFVRSFLWSYDPEKLDLSRDKKRIITNILNLGTVSATRWLFKVYSRKDINEVVSRPLPGELSKKSLNFWRLILGVKPAQTKRKLQ